MLVDVEFVRGKYPESLALPLPIRLNKGIYSFSYLFEDTCTSKLEWTFHPENISDRLEWANSAEYIANYGLCDAPEQILAKYPAIVSSDKQYIISLKLISKEEYPDFRFHKNGEYIGTQLCEGCEHFGNEPFMNEVIAFNVYQVVQ